MHLHLLIWLSNEIKQNKRQNKTKRSAKRPAILSHYSRISAGHRQILRWTIALAPHPAALNECTVCNLQISHWPLCNINLGCRALFWSVLILHDYFSGELKALKRTRARAHMHRHLQAAFSCCRRSQLLSRKLRSFFSESRKKYVIFEDKSPNEFPIWIMH